MMHGDTLWDLYRARYGAVPARLERRRLAEARLERRLAAAS